MRDQLEKELEDQKPPLRALVEAYFSRDQTEFAGELFNTLGPNDPYSIGPDDLLAVGFLDEAFDAEAAFSILVEDRSAYSRLLHEIPPDIDIWDEVANVENDSPANEMWNRLVSIKGVGPVRAGKLLARKRPRLIPIWDSVIESVFPKEGREFWTAMQMCMKDSGLRARVESLRRRGAWPLISTLRILDAALWMKRSQGEAAERVRQRVSSTAEG